MLVQRIDQALNLDFRAHHIAQHITTAVAEQRFLDVIDHRAAQFLGGLLAGSHNGRIGAFRVRFQHAEDVLHRFLVAVHDGVLYNVIKRNSPVFCPGLEAQQFGHYIAVLKFLGVVLITAPRLLVQRAALAFGDLVDQLHRIAAVLTVWRARFGQVAHHLAQFFHVVDRDFPGTTGQAFNFLFHRGDDLRVASS